MKLMIRYSSFPTMIAIVDVEPPLDPCIFSRSISTQSFCYYEKKLGDTIAFRISHPYCLLVLSCLKQGTVNNDLMERVAGNTFRIKEIIISVMIGRYAE